MWGPQWDERNLHLFAGSSSSVDRADVEAMFALGDWFVRPRPAAPDQYLLIGKTACLEAGGRVITVVAELVETPVGPRWWPVRARPARPREVALWHSRYDPGGLWRRLEAP